jgi:uncharacterized ParB-like nuclease family protein
MARELPSVGVAALVAAAEESDQVRALFTGADDEELDWLLEDPADEPDEDDSPVYPEAVAWRDRWLARQVDRAMRGVVTANVFCKTGRGGGIDPTCGKGGKPGPNTKQRTEQRTESKKEPVIAKAAAQQEAKSKKSAPTEDKPKATSAADKGKQGNVAQEAGKKLKSMEQVESDGYPSKARTGEVSTDNFFKPTRKGEMAEAVYAVDSLHRRTGDKPQSQFVKENSKPATVEISKLKSTQPTIEEAKVVALLGPKGLARLKEDAPADRPVVVKMGGEYYAWDGQHRLAAKQLAGEKKANVHLIDLDAGPAKGKKGK